MCAVTQDSEHVPCFAVWKFLVIFEQKALRFHFAMGPTNDVASPHSKVTLKLNGEFKSCVFFLFRENCSCSFHCTVFLVHFVIHSIKSSNWAVS